MPRFAYLAVVFGLVASAACSKEDTKYCAMNPTDEARCGMQPIDARLPDAPPQTCDGDGDCTIPGALACELDSGKCVECVAPGHDAACVGTKPVCNDRFACEACDSAADCPASDICLPSGACAAEDQVAYVVAGGADNPTCSKATPCSKLATGLAAVTGATPRPFLKIKGSFDEGVVIARNVTILADPGTKLTRGTNGAILTINGTSIVEISDLEVDQSNNAPEPGIITAGASELTLKRVTVSENKGNGITCQGKSLTIIGSKIVDNTGVGIACSAGRVVVSSSTIAGNRLGGISATAGSFDITNNFIFENGDKDSNSNVGGVSVDPAAGTMNRFEFNTVVDNHVRENGMAPTAGFFCDIDSFTAPNNIIASNDIKDIELGVNANIFSTGKCSYPSSTITGLPEDIGALKFISAGASPRNYHLQVDSSAIGTATTLSTVTVDFDGDSRPQDTGVDRGADEFKTP